MNFKITVIGLGYLGATSAIAFAKLGHEVIGIDPDKAKVSSLQTGRVPFYEPDLQEALNEVLLSGRISFKTEHDIESKDAQIHLICVGTPQSKIGLSADMSYLYSAVDALIPFLSEDSIVVGKSTVPVGTAANLKKYLSERLSFIPHVAWNPEFLQEGKALKDTLEPDRIVIGTQDIWSARQLKAFYSRMTEAGIPIVETDLETAELVKVAANSFLATKISFINAMAEIAEQTGADAVKLAEAIGHDDRIGHKFLRTGIGFGGGCLPKDIRAFQARAEELGVGDAVAFLTEVDAINNRRRSRVVDIAKSHFGSLVGRRATMLGATFKPETDDIRDSPSLAVAELLAAQGMIVTVHDPMGLHSVEVNHPLLRVEPKLKKALVDAELVVLGTEWKKYRNLDRKRIPLASQNNLVIDGRNALQLDEWNRMGWATIALGRSGVVRPGAVLETRMDWAVA